MPLVIAPHSKFVMIGDSITDCERAHPVGEGLFGALGTGYAALTNALIQASAPHAKIRVVNMGLSGNTVRELRARWQSDVVDLKPDWLSIMIGINDVWRQFDSPWQTDQHVPIDEYQQTLTSLVAETKPRVQGLILLTPYVIEPNRADPMRAQMDRYGAVVRMLAQQYNTLFVDTQAAFDPVLEHLHPMALAWDRIHPTTTGHMILAQALVQAVNKA